MTDVTGAVVRVTPEVAEHYLDMLTRYRVEAGDLVGDVAQGLPRFVIGACALGRLLPDSLSLRHDLAAALDVVRSLTRLSLKNDCAIVWIGQGLDPGDAERIAEAAHDGAARAETLH